MRVRLTKARVVRHFGTQQAVAELLGITKSMVCQWPEVLTDTQADRVISLSWRQGRPIMDRRGVGRDRRRQALVLQLAAV